MSGSGAVSVPSSATEPAYAKVNLGLAVLARRGDGYHEVETAMALIDVADEVTVTLEAADADSVELRASLAEDLVGPPMAVDPTNLAHLAAQRYLAARRAAQPDAVSVRVIVTLEKHVPIAAGLGGGSADAGAVLRLLSGSLPAEVDVAAIGRSLGSDVPFMHSGLRAALARGRGERLSPLAVPPLPLVLANAGGGVAAAEAYGGLVGFTPRLRFEQALERLSAGAEPGWPNGLQPGVLRLRPEVRGVLNELRAAGLKGVLLSGSGPTCFGIAGSPVAAAEAAARLAAVNPTWWVRSASTLAS